MAGRFPSIPDPGTTPQTLMAAVRAMKQVLDLITANSTGATNAAGVGAGAQVFALSEDVKRLIQGEAAKRAVEVNQTATNASWDLDQAAAKLNEDIAYSQKLAQEAREEALRKIGEVSTTVTEANRRIDTAFEDLKGITQEIFKIEDTGPDGIITARVATEAGARVTADKAIAGRIDKASAFVGLNEATWQVGQVSLSTRFEALSGSYTNYTAKYNDQYFATVNSKISAITDPNGAIATAVNSLETKLVDPVNGTVTASISSEAATRSKADSALSGRVDKAAAYIGLNEATWTVGQVSFADNFKSLSSSYSQYTTKYNDKYFADIQTQFTSITDANTGAIATAINNLSTKVFVPSSRPAGQQDLLTSAILTERNSVSDVNRKLSTAQDVNTVITSLFTPTGQVTAAVKVESDARVSQLGYVTSQYTVNVTAESDGTKSISGIQLISDTSLGTKASAFNVRADQFNVYLPGYGTKAVMSVKAVNGSNTLALDGNIIADGTIAARSLTVGTLSAIAADLGTVTAGLARDANSKFVIDFTNANITISD